jgi:hypothetical protein
MPHKHNADRRHHIPKMAFKVRNWPAYEAGLRRRGSLTLWIEDAALACWQTIGPSGQARYGTVNLIDRERNEARQMEPDVPMAMPFWQRR